MHVHVDSITIYSWKLFLQKFFGTEEMSIFFGLFKSFICILQILMDRQIDKQNFMSIKSNELLLMIADIITTEP